MFGSNYVKAGVALAALVAIGSQAGAEDEDYTEQRDVDKFDSVAVMGASDVMVTIGDKQSVTLVSKDSEELGHIETEVRRGELRIRHERSRGNHSSRRNQVTVLITVPELHSVQIAGSGDVDVTGISGGNFEVGIAGSGDVTLRGSCSGLEVDIAGSGDTLASELECDDVAISVMGSGDVEVHANNSVDATMMGSGDILVTGSPSDRSFTDMGSGGIRYRSK